MSRRKIALIGGGPIGGALAHLAMIETLGDVVLYEGGPGRPMGKALDLSDAAAVADTDVRVIGTNDASDIAGASVVIVTAGLPPGLGVSGDLLLSINLPTVRSVGQAIRRYAPDAFVVCATNPVDVMAWALQRYSGLPTERVVGSGNALDSIRFRSMIASELGVPVRDVQAMILGEHGEGLVPLIRLASIAGVALHEVIARGHITAEKVNALVERTRKGDVDILKSGSSSAYFAAAAAALAIAKSCLSDTKDIVPCAVGLRGEYGVDDLYIGVPARIGAKGVEEVVELQLNNEEADQFALSAAAVRAMVQKCETVDPNLALRKYPMHSY